MSALLLSLFLAALPAQAQMYKCVDARGKTQYSDKPMPGCKAEKTLEAPKPPPRPAPGAPAKAQAKAKPPAPPRGEMDGLTAAQRASRCKTLKEEHDWLLGPRGRGVASHAARVAQVERALRACQ